MAQSKPKDDLDNTTKNIVQELTREVTNKKLQIVPLFSIYYVNLLILDPSWGITPEELPDRKYVQKFVNHCIKNFSKKFSPSVATLTMQWQFHSDFEEVNQAVFKNRDKLKKRLVPLENEIVDCETDVPREMDKLFKKIVYLITLYSGLGNPAHQLVYEESETALRSIFTQDDLIEFMQQPPEEKEEQLVELTELVTGIRLFNRDCDKGGAGIEDLPKLLTKAIEISSNDIQKSLEVLLSITDKLTTAIDNCFRIDESEKFDFVLTRHLPNGVEEDDLEEMKDLLIMYRQHELLVRKVLIEINALEVVSNEKFKNLNSTLELLHETVKFKIAIPTVQVFPLFSEIAKIWCEIQNATILLSEFNHTLLNLQVHGKNTQVGEEILKSAFGHAGPLTDTERLEKTNDLKIPQIESDEMKILYPNDIPDFDKLELQYLGFCAWKFVETEGGLIPGNPNMGIIQVQSLNYVFSSPEAAVAFSKDPIRYMLRALKVAREKPEVINLLQLKDQLIVVRDIEQLVIEIPEVVVTHDVEVETEVHPIPTYIDNSYMWNIWDWKRQALLLATLSRCVTHSTQTVFSNGLSFMRSQTYDQREKICQTKKDNYSNVPTLSNFIYGLRGRKDHNQHIITLTRPVDE